MLPFELSTSLAAALSSLAVIAFAQTSTDIPVNVPVTTAALERTETVVIRNPKNAAVMDYDTAYERLKRMQDSKLDRVKLEVRIKPSNEAVPISNVRVAIINDETNVPVVVKPDGLVVVAMRDDLYKTKAEILTNQPKGSLDVSVTLGITWRAAQEIPFSEVEETVRQLEVAGKDVMGWFAYMVFFPSLKNIEVPLQYPEPRGQTLKIVKDGRVLKTFTADDKGKLLFKLDPAWSTLQPTLVFSERPPEL
jgi:hypothetical protein